MKESELQHGASKSFRKRVNIGLTNKLKRNGISCLRRALPRVPFVKRCVQLPSPEHWLSAKLLSGGSACNNWRSGCKPPRPGLMGSSKSCQYDTGASHTLLSISASKALYCCLPNFGRCGRSQDRVSANCLLVKRLYLAESMAEKQIRTVDHPF